MSNKKLSPEIQAILSASDAGLHATTISLVQQFLVENPDSPRGWIDLGRAFAQIFRFDEAEQALELQKALLSKQAELQSKQNCCPSRATVQAELSFKQSCCQSRTAVQSLLLSEQS